MNWAATFRAGCCAVSVNKDAPTEYAKNIKNDETVELLLRLRTICLDWN